MSTEKTAAAKAAAAKKPAFPREVVIVNDTPVDYVLCGKFAAKGSATPVAVNDADALTRLQSDCEQIIELNDAYKGDKQAALRITEAE